MLVSHDVPNLSLLYSKAKLFVVTQRYYGEYNRVSRPFPNTFRVDGCVVSI